MKELFPYFAHHPDLVYLDSAATTHKPKVVIDALTCVYEQENATVHRAIYRSSLSATDRYNATRETVQKFLNAKRSEEIIFTRGTTSSINLVARSYGKMVLKPGDEILISIMEHHSNIVPWQMIAQETGAILKYISVNEKGELLWQNTITPKTKIVALAHVSNVTGTTNPMKEIAKEAHKHGAVVLVDGAQSAPHMKIDVQDLDCDFFAFSGHKCYGPTGVGVLYGKYELLEKMPPIEGGGDMIQTVELDHSTYQLPPLRFEAGTPIIGPVIALKSAIDFILSIGLDKIAQHEQKLLERATKGLLQIPGLRIIGTSSEKGPLITFTIEGVHPLDVTTMLDLQNIAIRSGHLCAQPILREFGLKSAMRVSFGIYNTEEEVDYFIRALSEIVRLLKS
ncbi:MAG TPA: cysteine desulfurase [Chlamydiales bacterium]|nr:cysteine desulfurase [Chlamydiales bacterium]